MLYAIAARAATRLVVLAYDIACPRRARAVRGTLAALHHAKQYSVFEAMLGEGELRGLLAELASDCDFPADRLAAWWPLDGLRLGWRAGALVADARDGAPCGRVAALPANTGNFILCYDVSDPDALHAVAGVIAPSAAMVQRSVYWLRAPARRLSALLGRCAPHLAETDRLWAYPLRASRDLWQVGSPAGAILPIATHQWGPA